MNRPLPPNRPIRFGHPLRTTAIAGFLYGLVYRLLLAGAMTLNLIPAALAPSEVIGAVVIASAVVAVIARHEARFAGLRWHDYERMSITTIAVVMLPLIFWSF